MRYEIQKPYIGYSISKRISVYEKIVLWIFRVLSYDIPYTIYHIREYAERSEAYLGRRIKNAGVQYRTE